jgi:hypothetical protein
MEIEEFVERKQELEIDILKALSEIVDKFKKETSYFPCEINITVKDMRTPINCFKEERNYFVSNVKCEFNIL